MCVCAHVCAHVRVCVGARERERVNARECVRVVLLIQHATHMRHTVTSFVAPLAPPNLPT
jgi:hypothetical protein